MPDTIIAPVPERPSEAFAAQCVAHRVRKVAIMRPASGTAAGVSFSEPACPHCAKEAAERMGADLKRYYLAELRLRMGDKGVKSFMRIYPGIIPDPENPEMLGACLQFAASLKGISVETIVGDMLVQGRYA